MVQVPVNYLAVVVSAIASMVIGFLWYGSLFGKQWMALSGINPAKIDEAKKQSMGKGYALAFVGSLLTAYILNHVIALSNAYFSTSGIQAGLTSGFWMWLGFVVPVTLNSLLWEGKPLKLWILNTSYYLVMFLIVGGILAVWM